MPIVELLYYKENLKLQANYLNPKSNLISSEEI